MNRDPNAQIPMPVLPVPLPLPKPTALERVVRLQEQAAERARIEGVLRDAALAAFLPIRAVLEECGHLIDKDTGERLAKQIRSEVTTYGPARISLKLVYGVSQMPFLELAVHGNENRWLVCRTEDLSEPTMSQRTALEVEHRLIEVIAHQFKIPKANEPT